MARIAFYGTLRRGYRAQRELGVERWLRFVGPCEIAGRRMKHGAYPGLVPGDDVVAAELFDVLDRRALAILDEYEQFDPKNRASSLYIHEEVRLLSPDCLAWVYFANV